MSLTIAQLESIKNGTLGIQEALATEVSAESTMAQEREERVKTSKGGRGYVAKGKSGRGGGRPKGSKTSAEKRPDPYAKMESLIESYHKAIIDDDSAGIERAIRQMAAHQDDIEQLERRGIVLDQWSALDECGSGSLDENEPGWTSRDYAYQGQVGAMHKALVQDRHCDDTDPTGTACEVIGDSDFPKNRYVGKQEFSAIHADCVTGLYELLFPVDSSDHPAIGSGREVAESAPVASYVGKRWSNYEWRFYGHSFNGESLDSMSMADAAFARM